MPAQSDPRSALREELLRRREALSAGAGAASGPRTPAPGAGGGSALVRRGAKSAPLSFAQELLWLLDRTSGSAHAYNVARAARLRGDLDLPALNRTLDAILERHEILRTTYELVDDEPRQIVGEPRPVPIEHVDLREVAENLREAEAARVVRELTRRPFDLAHDLQLRASLVQLAGDDFVLLLESHHVAADGWSRGILLRELTQLYDGFRRGVPAELPPLPLQFADYAAWQRDTLQGTRLETLTAYWREKLANVAPLELPTDRPQPEVASFEGGSHVVVFPPELLEGLRNLSRSHQATMFMTLLAAFQVLLARYCGQDDILVGSPIAGRTSEDVSGLIGYFVNTLLLRGSVAGDPPFTELLAHARETCLGAYEHQEVPYEKLVLDLRSLAGGHAPAVRAMFTMQDAEPAQLGFDGLSLTPFGSDRGASKFDLGMFVKETPNGLRAELHYRTELFDRPTIERMAANFGTLLASIVAAPGEHVSRLPMLAADQRRQLLEEWTATTTDYPRDSSIAGVFGTVAAANPDAVALLQGTRALTYRELDESANRVARRLQKLGVDRDVPVGLCAGRSIEAVVGALGILKAGGLYVPLDPRYPAERLAFMVSDTGLRIVVSTRAFEGVVPGVPHVLRLDADRELLASESPLTPPCPAGAESGAYIIYTSGSTGLPKGVTATQRGVVRLVRGARYAHFGPDEVVLGFAPLTFDASTFEIWGALLNGGRLALFGDEAPSLDDLSDAIGRYGVTTLWLTAALFHQMVDRNIDALRGVRQLLAGGDVLSVPHVRRALHELPDCTLVNGYGPTENTTFTTCFRIPRDWNADGASISLPIGRPIENTTVYVLDAAFEPVPAGVAGRLYAGGDGVARGYHNRPELTDERFLRDPFRDVPGARMYDTGDRVRWRADGTIEFLGRADQQLKVRGFRVEPGEIEAALMRHPSVLDAVVVGRDDTDDGKRLIGYAIPRSGEQVEGEALRAFLAARLPAYLVPSIILPLAAFPVTPNGKLDRAQLPDPSAAGVARAKSYVAPRDAIETRLAQLFAETLRLERVGVTDDFFELGGHSLLAMRLMSKVATTFDSHLPLKTLILNPTVEGLARILGTRRDPNESPLLALRTAGTAPPFFYLHGDFTSGDYCERIAAGLDADQPMYVLPPHGTNGRPFPATVEAMARDYVALIRQTHPVGPYALGGFCAGGLVAFEMARQLVAQKDTVSDVVLIDCSGANAGMSRLAEAVVALGTFCKIPESRYLSALAALGRLALRIRRARRFLRASGVRASYRRVLSGPAGGNAGEERLPLEAAWRKIQAAYIHRRYSGRVTLMSVNSETPAEMASRRGWRAVARSVEVIPLRGTHLACIAENVDETAAKVGDVLSGRARRHAE